MKKFILCILLLVVTSGCTVGLQWKDGKLGLTGSLDGTQIVDGVENLWTENRGDGKLYDKVEEKYIDLKSKDYEKEFKYGVQQ